MCDVCVCVHVCVRVRVQVVKNMKQLNDDSKHSQAENTEKSQSTEVDIKVRDLTCYHDHQPCSLLIACHIYIYMYMYMYIQYIYIYIYNL